MSSQPATPKHILVVEDDPDFAGLLRWHLTRAGYTVTIAHSCEDALAEARNRRPDAVTLDVHMPRKSGAFFYRQLKEDEAFRDVPVIVVTGLTYDKEMESIIRQLLEPEHLPAPEAYLEKPIDGPRFLQLVEQVLASGGGRSGT